MRRLITLMFKVKDSNDIDVEYEADVSILLNQDIDGLDIDKHRGMSRDYIEDIDVIEMRVISKHYPPNVWDSLVNAVYGYEFDI